MMISTRTYRALRDVQMKAEALRKLEIEFDLLPWEERSTLAAAFVDQQYNLRAALDEALSFYQVVTDGTLP